MSLVRTSQLSHKNQMVLWVDDCIYFQSYETIIARWNDRQEELSLHDHWDCSATTRRHLYEFLTIYTPFKSATDKKRVLALIRAGIFKVLDLNN